MELPDKLWVPLFALLLTFAVGAALAEQGPEAPSAPPGAPRGAESPSATVLGEEVRTADPGEMQQIIITRLFDQYAAEHAIEAQAPEIDAFVGNLQRAMAADENMTAESDLTPEEVEQLQAIRRDMARSIIRYWKINRELYQEYGGRIIYQQLGPEPLDAYHRFLLERQRAGAFKINDPAMAASFWRYFTEESMHTFMEPGGDDEARAFSVAPWEQTSAES